MTYTWTGKGCLRFGGKFYTDKQIIPHDEMPKNEVERLLKTGQIKQVSISTEDGAGSSAPDLVATKNLAKKAAERVKLCNDKISEFTADDNDAKVEEWNNKLIEATTALEQAEQVVSDIEEGE